MGLTKPKTTLKKARKLMNIQSKIISTSHTTIIHITRIIHIMKVRIVKQMKIVSSFEKTDVEKANQARKMIAQAKATLSKHKPLLAKAKVTLKSAKRISKPQK